jgi:hypothetical protein
MKKRNIMTTLEAANLVIVLIVQQYIKKPYNLEV